MGYQALLFCPDEKTARAVTQVLSELDFSVEPCTEPFAAVKKLMAQHFDAVVVDCDNEQNATLLFKSARNSSSNQSSLAVAVVEGQTGVAKAFRIGANLVLTKPINIEQAKGTLRVARGLLRKGSDPARSTAPAATASQSIAATPAPAAASPRPAGFSVPASRPATASGPAKSLFPAAPAPKATPVKPAPAAVAQGLKSDAEVVATTPESSEVSASPKPSASAAAPASVSSGAPKKSYPWQPAKPGAEPMASALRKAAEVAGLSQTDEAKPADVAPAKAAEKPVVAASATTAHGAASAPAPAKEKSVEDVPLITPATRNKAVAVENSPVVEIDSEREEKARGEVDPPSFSMGASAFDEEEPANNKKALLIVAGVVLLASLAGYLGWKNTSGKSSPASTAPASTTAPAAAGNTAPSADETKAPEASASETPAGNSVAHTTAPVPAPAAAASKPSPVSKNATHEAPAKKEEIAPDTTVEQPAAPAIVVKNGPAPSAKKPAQDSDQALVPSAIDVGTGADTKALAAISSAPVSVPRPSGDVVKISQGVSEGLVLKRVAPRYPSQALQMRKEGSVQLQATVTKTGDISNVKVLSGDSILARAAEDAVRQWKYKPYYLNGEPVDIQTQITVNFKLPR